MEGSGRPYDDIEYVTLAQGTKFPGPKVAKEAVINDVDAYTRFFEGSPPEMPEVNWEEEMVVAVALGTRGGGDSVEITSIIHHTIGSRQGSVEIRYAERVPSGYTTMDITYPYHVVKCQRVGYRYNFSKETDRLIAGDGMLPRG